MKFNVTNPVFEAGKTPFHRVWNQVSVMIDNDNADIPEGFYPAGTFITSAAVDTSEDIFEDPEGTFIAPLQDGAKSDCIQGILAHDVIIKRLEGKKTVSVAFAGVLYPKVTNDVNKSFNGVDTVAWLHAQGGTKTSIWAKNFKAYGVRKASDLKNKI